MAILCLDRKPTPDFSGTRVIDTSNPLKKTGTPPGFEPDQSTLCVALTLHLNFLVKGDQSHFLRLRVDFAQTSGEAYLYI